MACVSLSSTNFRVISAKTGSYSKKLGSDSIDIPGKGKGKGKGDSNSSGVMNLWVYGL